ncbi:hypothetical protein VaNZ11_013532 [Volvox africanus]|uniref:Pherophorin domain-containing protein n=1 Tax=Volvox africanus TaxID=51714 RepID=A0ABQ5SGK9_9CHLO|nr:hypothetical protein VaNZ11_013532 [Volvox africanus]
MTESCSTTTSVYQALNGRYGTIKIRPGDSCSYLIKTRPASAIKFLVLTANGLDGRNVEAWVCSSPDCDSNLVLDLTEGAITQLLAMDYPNGLWLNVHAPADVELPSWASLDFSSWTDTCTGAGRTPLLFYHTPFDSSLEPGPTYSICVPRPDHNTNSGRISFTWSWVLKTLPPSLAGGGFYAQVSPFPVTMRAGAYQLQSTLPAPAVAHGGDQLPFSIRVLLLDDAEHTVAELTESLKTYYVVPNANTSRAIIECYVPPDIADLQNVTVDVLRASSRMPESPPPDAHAASPPPPPQLDMCRPVSSPMGIGIGLPPTYTIKMPITAYASVPFGWDVDATTLRGGCAFRFPSTTSTGDRVARHCLFFASAPSPYSAAFAWLGSSPNNGQILLTPGSAAALPVENLEMYDDMTVLLSGNGRSAPLVVEYMAELASCAAPNAVLVHLIPENPRLSEDVALSICAAAPNVTVDVTSAQLDLSFGWAAGALPSIFNDVAGFNAEFRNHTLATGMRLPAGWYRASFQLPDPGITVLQLKLGRMNVTRNSTFYMEADMDTISVSVAMPPISRDVRIGIRLVAVQLGSASPPTPSLSGETSPPQAEFQDSTATWSTRSAPATLLTPVLPSQAPPPLEPGSPSQLPLLVVPVSPSQPPPPLLTPVLPSQAPPPLEPGSPSQLPLLVVPVSPSQPPPPLLTPVLPSQAPPPLEPGSTSQLPLLVVPVSPSQPPPPLLTPVLPSQAPPPLEPGSTSQLPLSPYSVPVRPFTALPSDLVDDTPWVPVRPGSEVPRPPSTPPSLQAGTPPRRSSPEDALVPDSHAETPSRPSPDLTAIPSSPPNYVPVPIFVNKPPVYGPHPESTPSPAYAVRAPSTFPPSLSNKIYKEPKQPSSANPQQGAWTPAPPTPTSAATRNYINSATLLLLGREERVGLGWLSGADSRRLWCPVNLSDTKSSVANSVCSWELSGCQFEESRP